MNKNIAETNQETNQETHKETNQEINQEKEAQIERIIKLEWDMFDKTQNEGGRAECQNNYPTFFIMRKSQYLTWTEELLTSYERDLVEGRLTGRNLITEKYGRMMESTAPAEYEKIKHSFPELSEGRKEITEAIIAVQVKWMEEFSVEYPKLADQARSIHTSEDSAYNTSYETYLRGEIGTYSEETFLLYGRFIIDLAQRGENLARMTMQNTVQMYGYATLEDAAAKK